MNGSHGGIPDAALRSDTVDRVEQRESYGERSAAAPSASIPASEGRATAAPGLGPAPPPRRWGQRALVAIAAVCAIFSLTVPLGQAGLWAPYELDVADLARRLAVGLHGAELAIEGTDNQTPLLSELGKGQLPFSAIALGFQSLGLRDWAGRLPLVLSGLVALWLMGRALVRLCGVRAASFAVAVVATMPVFFVQARALLGDGMTLACGALSLFSLSVLAFAPPQTTRGRVGWGFWALVGLAGGFTTRGAAFGVALPCGSVALAFLTCRGTHTERGTPWGHRVGWLCVALASLATAASVWAVARQDADLYLEVMGSTLSSPAKPPTYDQVLHRIGFVLFPWSAVLPMALVGAFSPQPSGSYRRPALRLVLVHHLVLAIAAHAALSYYQQPVPFVGAAAAGCLIALAFEDYERAEARTRLVALTGCALLITIGLDLKNQPAQSLWAFEVPKAVFPESFANAAGSFYKYLTLGCVAVVGLSLGQWSAGEAPEGEPAPRGAFGVAAARCRQWLRRLRPLARKPWAFWLGALWLVAVALWASRLLDVRLGASLPAAFRSTLGARVLGAVALAGPLIAVGPCVGWLLAGCWQAVLRLWPWPPSRLGLLALAAAGLTSSLVFYPRVARQLSPRTAFESFANLSGPGEPLAVMGEAARVAPYYVDAETHTPRSARAAVDWLSAADARRWLVLPKGSLAALNQIYRSVERTNVPVLDTAMSGTTLVSDRLLPGERNDNPFDPFVAQTPPKVQHPLDVELDNGALRCLGWSVTDSSGQWVENPRPGKPYQFRIHWKVERAPTRDWRVFVHIDGQGRRFNGDHDPLKGQYATRHWARGDYISDAHDVKFGSEFGGKRHEVYFGLYRGKKRLPVTRGNHHENRIRAGKLTLAR